MRASPGVDRLRDLRQFGSNPGALRARFYVPEALPSNAPLVVVLHGCTQTAAEYDHGSGWSRLADLHKFALLYPEQRRANNAMLCFNWFEPDDIRRDAGEALSIRQMIEALAVQHGIDRRRIFVTGLSAGGAMTSVMLATYPELFAAGAIIAGLPYGSAASVPEAFDRMRGHGVPTEQALQSILRSASLHEGPWPSISIWHGDVDDIVLPSNAAHIRSQWRSVHELDGMSTYSGMVDGHPYRAWRGADGRVLVEEYLIVGMRHGVPIATTGPRACGVAQRFMIDMGISSTFHIARACGLIETGDAQAERHVRTTPDMSRHPVVVAPIQECGSRTQASRDDSGDGESFSLSGPAARVKTVIEDALRTAGLMR
jgi:poly(hydroxyalkanoate) depolymerase family esterase